MHLIRVITERKDGSNKTHFKYVTPEKKTLKSANLKDVEQKLRKQGVLEQFLKGDEMYSINKREIDLRQPSASRPILEDKLIDDDDPDYKPPARKEMKRTHAEDTKEMVSDLLTHSSCKNFWIMCT